ncbi:MAG TPA: hypothetical protein PK208_15890 [Fibrobacteria bacterium]|nr:hypothetical protein [Fibrobacteria bacterium]
MNSSTPDIDIDLKTRKAVVAAWLEQNIRYARSHVRKAVAAKDGDKVRDWETWRSFSEHALGELEGGALDMWMLQLGNPDFDPTSVDEVASSFGDA